MRGNQVLTEPPKNTKLKELIFIFVANVGCQWLFVQKPLETPNRPKPLQSQLFPENAVLPRNLPGIPTEFI